MGDDARLLRGYQHDGVPAGVGEVRSIPAVLYLASVQGFAVIEFRLQDWGNVRFPGFVGYNPIHRAVGTFEAQLCA